MSTFYFHAVLSTFAPHDVKKYEIKCQMVLEDYILISHTSLVLLISNSTAKTKLAILTFLCCDEFVKNSIAENDIILGGGNCTIYICFSELHSGQQIVHLRLNIRTDCP